MKRPLFAVVGACLLAATATAQITKSGVGYLLRVKYVKGTTLKFTSQNSVGGKPGAPAVGSHFVMPINLVILDVKKQVADVRLELMPVKLGNQVISPGQKAVIKLNNRNQDPDGQVGGAGNVGAQLPAGAVKIGQSWTAVAPVRTGFGNGNLNATYVFAGLKTVRGRAVAIINYRVSGAATGVGRLALLVSDGTLFSNDVQLKLSLGDNGSITLVSGLTRL